jgi:hypothetical protein
MTSMEFMRNKISNSACNSGKVVPQETSEMSNTSTSPNVKKNDILSRLSNDTSNRQGSDVVMDFHSTDGAERNISDKSEKKVSESNLSAKFDMKASKSKSRWNMVSAIVADQASSAVLKDIIAKNEQSEEISPANHHEEGKNPPKGLNYLVKNTKEDNSNAMADAKSDVKKGTTTSKPINYSFATIVKKRIRQQKRSLNIIDANNETYDSDEDKVASNILYACKKTSCELKRYRSCPDFEHMQRVGQKRGTSKVVGLARRISFPSLEVEVWKQSITGNNAVML